MSALNRALSAFPSIPGLHWLSPSAPSLPSAATLSGYLEAQELALCAAQKVASLVRPGWTEKQAASLLDTYLHDCGVRSFFHKGFAWFGDRTRFAGVTKYAQFAPSDRVLRENEVFILDVAPILHGFICDIGYSSCYGENLAFDKAQIFLTKVREAIPALFSPGATGQSVCESVDGLIRSSGYEAIHHLYPFSVLGHRVHQGVSESGNVSFLGFGWQSYWEFLSRGLLGQLLNKDYRGQLDGLWAIEPHLGTKDFGVKFEEILVVEQGRARWLGDSAGFQK
jgi:Xaa-Pro aminopeptidase